MSHPTAGNPQSLRSTRAKQVAPTGPALLRSIYKHLYDEWKKLPNSAYSNAVARSCWQVEDVLKQHFGLPI